MKSILLSIITGLFLSNGLFAEVNEYDVMGCKERNTEGFCIKGKLTELFETGEIKPSWIPEDDKSHFATCEESCQKGCPNCSNCKWCWGCSMYSADSCNGVFFYENANSCAGRRTTSCCELCQSQCDGNDTICSDNNYCHGGDPMNSIFGQCNQKVFNRSCPRCNS